MQRIVCLAGLLTFAVTSSGAETPVVVPVDGETFRGTLTAVDAKWQLTFDVDGTPRVLGAADVVRWGGCPEARRGPLVLLADGGMLRVDVLQADRKKLSGDSPVFGPVSLPLESVVGIVPWLPGEPQRRDRIIGQVAQATGHADRLILQNGDQLTGTIEAIDDTNVRLRRLAGVVEIPIDRTAAVVFNPDLLRRKSPEGLRATAGFADGSRLIATGLTGDASAMKVTTTAGRVWQALAEDLVYLQPIGGRVTYLSDLPVAEFHPEPYLTLTWPYATDRNLHGGHLRAGGQFFLKGLAVHSYARLKYSPDGTYRRFQATLAVDDCTKGRGSVRFRIYVDGKEKYASPIIRGGDIPLPITVDIVDARRLDLLVEYADGADHQDHADWLEARLVK